MKRAHSEGMIPYFQKVKKCGRKLNCNNKIQDQSKLIVKVNKSNFLMEKYKMYWITSLLVMILYS